MKTKLIILLLITIPFCINAQNWAPTGAIWHYSQSTINPGLHTYKTIESLGDTVIDGVACKHLLETERYIDPTITRSHFMFSRNDSVFFYADSAFNLLYDFGAQEGDTIVLPYFHIYDNSPLKMIIDSVRTININGHSRILQNISCGDGIFVEFGPQVIEGIGATYFMFPTHDGDNSGPLRCYEDADIGLYKNSFYLWTWSCDSVYYTGINDYEQKNTISVYPNPANNKINISNINTMTEFRIINIMGAVVKTGHVMPEGEIDISSLSGGLYLIELFNGDVRSSRRLIKN